MLGRRLQVDGPNDLDPGAWQKMRLDARDAALVVALDVDGGVGGNGSDPFV